MSDRTYAPAPEELNEEQSLMVERVMDRVMAKTKAEVASMARMLVTKSNAEFFGQTEFIVRDRSHRMVAGILEVALDERKRCHIVREANGGITDPA